MLPGPRVHRTGHVSLPNEFVKGLPSLKGRLETNELGDSASQKPGKESPTEPWQGGVVFTSATQRMRAALGLQ